MLRAGQMALRFEFWKQLGLPLLPLTEVQAKRRRGMGWRLSREDFRQGRKDLEGYWKD